MNAATQVQSASGLSSRQRWTILGVCAMSLFLVGLDTTIVNVALPSIGAGLSVGTRELEWVVDAYTLVVASLLISSGALADRLGRRRVFRVGLVVFGLGSLACAAAPSAGVLIAARVVQGAGASMLSPVALAIVVNAMPDPRERARAIGVWGSVFGLSMAAGPSLGGALIAALDWRAVFWVNAPVIAAALVLTVIVLPESKAEIPRPLDVPGQVLLTLAVLSFVAALIEGQHHGWVAPAQLALYAAVAVTGVGFVVAERRQAQPMIDLGLFRRLSVTGAVLGAIAVFIALGIALLLNTFYLQHARGWTPLQSGLATLPMALGSIVCAPLAGAMVARRGPRRPMLLSGVFLLAGGLVLCRLATGTPVAVLLAGYLLVGVGFGFANAPITNTAVSGLPPARAGVAGAITSTARQLGSAIGIALGGALVGGVATAHLAAATRPGWLIVSAAGVVMLGFAQLAQSAKS